MLIVVSVTRVQLLLARGRCCVQQIGTVNQPASKSITVHSARVKSYHSVHGVQTPCAEMHTQHQIDYKQKS